MVQLSELTGNNGATNGAGSAWRTPEKIARMSSVQFMDGLWREWASCGKLLEAAQVAAAVAPYQHPTVAPIHAPADDEDREGQACRSH
jgi:hypothetical protein